MSNLKLFFDVDDTLYPPSTGIWDLIGDRIDLFIQQKIGLQGERIAELRKRLFQTYGTTLRGLVVEYGIDREEYLEFVHAVPIESILKPDSHLRTLLLGNQSEKVIFTNADKKYAARVIRSLGLEGCFSRIIDIVDIWPTCKPQEEAFNQALGLAGLARGEEGILFDDTPANLDTASALGFSTVLVGGKPLLNGSHARIAVIHDFPLILAEILRNP